MKKCFLITTLALFFSGCDNYRKMTPEEIAERDKEKAREEHKKHVDAIKSRMEIIDYNGHSYVVYSKYERVWGHNGVNVVSLTHNPDCPCYNKNK